MDERQRLSAELKEFEMAIVMLIREQIALDAYTRAWFGDERTQTFVDTGEYDLVGFEDLSLKNNILYANNGPHLVLFDISDIHHVFIIDKIKSVFEVNAKYPPPNTWFECINESNIWITGWTDAWLVNPKCKS